MIGTNRIRKYAQNCLREELISPEDFSVIHCLGVVPEYQSGLKTVIFAPDPFTIVQRYLFISLHNHSRLWMTNLPRFHLKLVFGNDPLSIPHRAAVSKRPAHHLPPRVLRPKGSHGAPTQGQDEIGRAHV